MTERPPRVLLKLSGEALCAPGGRGFDVAVATPLAQEIAATAAAGVELAVVVGAGNLFRGAELGGSTVPRDSADRMGMLATLMNGVFLRDLLVGLGKPTELLTAISASWVNRATVEPEFGDERNLPPELSMVEANSRSTPARSAWY